MSALSHYGTKVLRTALKDALVRREAFLHYTTEVSSNHPRFLQFAADAEHSGEVAACLIADLGGLASAW